MLRSLPCHVLLAVVVLGLTVPAQPAGLPLTVTNPSSTPMVDAPVSFGIPSPAGPVPITDLDANAITIVDAGGVPVPAQFKVLSRWNGEREDATKRIKWFLATFLADCAASGTATYYVSVGWRPPGQLSVSSSSSAYTVTTAPGTSFVIDRSGFALFREVQVNGQQVVAAPGGGLSMIDSAGVAVNPVVTETAIEDQGSVRAVIRQRGTLGALRFTARWYFHTGRSDVAVDFRLENPGTYGYFFQVPSHNVYFDSLYLRLPVQGAGATAVSSVASRSLGGQPYTITQDMTTPPSNDPFILDNFVFNESVGTSQVGTGQRYEGAFDVAGPAAGVSVAVDRFWQTYPKALKLQSGEARVGLFPEWGHGPEYKGQYETPWSTVPSDPMSLSNYRFEGGRWRTQRIVFDFHTGTRTPQQVAALAERTNRPPMGRPLPWWVKHTGATGLFFTEKRKWNEDSMKRYERFNEMLVNDGAADDLGWVEGGRVGLKYFREHGGLYGGKQYYGWDTFGDLWWGDGYANLHYDWAMIMLLQWYRGGSYEFYDVGRDMNAFRRDYGQNHTTDLSEPWAGCAFYEKGYWHGNTFFGDEAHNWIHGMLLHYAMTGDEASREAAIENLGYVMRHSPSNWSGYYGARVPGWGIENLLDAWNYLGYSYCLSEAEAGIRRFKHFEAQFGTHGYVVDPSTYFGGNSLYPPRPALADPWLHNIFFMAAARYTLMAHDPTHLDLLDRMRNWFRTECLIPLSGPPNSMVLPAVWKEWAPGGTWQGTQSVHLLWPMMESFAWSAIIFNDTNDYNTALNLFDVLVRFHQEMAGTTVNMFDASHYSKIAVRMPMFPSSETKILSNMLRWSMALPFLKTWQSGTY